MRTLLLFLFISNLAFSVDKLKVENFNWNGVEVVWLEEDRFPTYDIVIYYGEGALADKKRKEGQVNLMFSMLTNGTPKYSQAQLAEKFDFYGTGLDSSLTHEYSTLSYSGLAQDAVPVTQLVCHVLKEANFPMKELNSVKKRAIGSLKNLVANHGALANRIFRKISFGETPFSSFTSGSINSLKNMTRTSLLKSRDYFNKNVYKKIFISGPKEVLKVKESFNKYCNWGKQNKLFQRTKNPPKKFYGFEVSKKTKVPLYFASVDGANQAQIRIGTALPVNYFNGTNFDLSKLSSTILGGSFTSLLMRELRVKRGLTYSAFSAASPQYLYGRLVVSTSTKNETVLETLYTIRDTLEILTKGKVTQERVDGTKKYLKGKHLFQFESQASFLSNLVMFDHLGRKYNEIYEFPKNLETFSRKQVIDLSQKIFDWDKQIVFVLGDKKLKKKILKSNLFDLKEVKINNFL